MHVVRGNISLMLIAGIDTTWSSIGAALWHLAQHPDDRRRLVEEPALIPTAVEELLRAYSPVTMARIARHDTTIGDREVKEGERVLLSFPAANRDPAVFDRPDEVIIDRELNRHVAFGAGIHRCVGSNLARMEMQVAIEEFLAMIPEFELADPAAVTWAGGQVRGPRNLPIRFPSRRPAARRSDGAAIDGGGAGADARRADARRRRAGHLAAALRRRGRRVCARIAEVRERPGADRRDPAVMAPPRLGVRDRRRVRGGGRRRTTGRCGCSPSRPRPCVVCSTAWCWVRSSTRRAGPVATAPTSPIVATR